MTSCLLVVLMRLLGHKSLAMTMRYLRAVQETAAAEQHIETMRGDKPQQPAAERPGAIATREIAAALQPRLL